MNISLNFPPGTYYFGDPCYIRDQFPFLNSLDEIDPEKKFSHYEGGGEAPYTLLGVLIPTGGDGEFMNTGIIKTNLSLSVDSGRLSLVKIPDNIKVSDCGEGMMFASEDAALVLKASGEYFNLDIQVTQVNSSENLVSICPEEDDDNDEDETNDSRCYDMY